MGESPFSGNICQKRSKEISRCFFFYEKAERKRGEQKIPIHSFQASVLGVGFSVLKELIRKAPRAELVTDSNTVPSFRHESVWETVFTEPPGY